MRSNRFWALFIASIAGMLPSGITPETSSDRVFAQGDNISVNSVVANKSSNGNFTNTNLTNNLLFKAELGSISNLSASLGSSSPVQRAGNDLRGDFNGDGKDDLAIGVPLEDVITNTGTITDAGAVNVIYGSSVGLSSDSTIPDQFFVQGNANVNDVAELGDFFGCSLAAGDFNGDGKDDLAIGVQGEDVFTEAGTMGNAGAVNVIYGSSVGLSSNSTIPDQFFVQGNAGVNGIAQSDDGFGFSLSAADFDGDSKDDLVIGVPGEDVVLGAGSVENAGAINVIYGSSSGLMETTMRPDQFLAQGDQNVNDIAETTDLFGAFLSTADFNGDGKDDLAVGVIGEDFLTGTGTITNAGGVNVIYGSSGGLSATSSRPDQFFAQGNESVNDVAEVDDQFGYSLSAGDFNGDGRDDLAISVQWEDVVIGTVSLENAGAVSVIYGSSGGLSATSSRPDQFLIQGNASVNDVPEVGDRFGYSLTGGEFDGDGKDDLAIGVPGEGLVTGTETVDLAGAVSVIYGSSGGLSATSSRPDQTWTQNSPDVNDVAETLDFFAFSLLAADFNGDPNRKDDLVIGVLQEDIATLEGTITDGGALNVLYGSSNGLSATLTLPDQFLVQGDAGLDGVLEGSDFFGYALG